MANKVPDDYRELEDWDDEEIKELKEKAEKENKMKVPDGFLPQRVFRDNEIKEIIDKAKQEATLQEKKEGEEIVEKLAKMGIEDTVTIMRLHEEVAFWKRFFITSYVIFLLLEGLWILLYLLKG